MSGCCNCSCEGSGAGASRREVLAAMTAAAVAMPLLGKLASAEPTTAPAEGASAWVKTVKATELVDNAAKAVPGHSILLTRSGSTVLALSPKCTHKGCAVVNVPDQKSVKCPCHAATFDLSGVNTSGPRKSPPNLKPLARYGLRLDADGVIEVDTSHVRKAEDKDGELTLSA